MPSSTHCVFINKKQRQIKETQLPHRFIWIAKQVLHSVIYLVANYISAYPLNRKEKDKDRYSNANDICQQKVSNVQDLGTKNDRFVSKVANLTETSNAVELSDIT